MTTALNPAEILWTDANRYEDGTPFTADQFKAYELGVATGETSEVTPVLVLPTAYGVGKSPIPDAVKGVVGTTQYVALRTIDKQDQVSDWSGRIAVRFTGRPLAPSGLAFA